MPYAAKQLDFSPAAEKCNLVAKQCVTSILTCKANSIINLFENIVCCAITFLYYKINRKNVLCVYGVIMHLGNVKRILDKRVKHSATPRVLLASLVFSWHFPRALSHHKRTRLVFYFLNKHISHINIYKMYVLTNKQANLGGRKPKIYD